jgi:uncharacterized protein (TIGR04222 family)
VVIGNNRSQLEHQKPNQEEKMQALDLELFREIQAFRLSDPTAEVSFEAKLAQENNWTSGYAELVTQEYRKFLLLTQVRGQMICPSDDVDQAWHLHLTQTVSYKRMCDEIFGVFLHHHASRGGEDELKKHQAMYQSTLESYRDQFQQEPDATIWPGVGARFMGKPTSKANESRVSTHSFPLRSGWLMALMAVAAGFVFHITIGRSLWTVLTGSEFLLLYVLLLLVACWLPAVFRHRVKRTTRTCALDPYEVACLEGGTHRVLGTALTRLIDLGMLKLQAQRESNKITGATCERSEGTFELDKVKKVGRGIEGLHPLERKILAHVPSGKVEVDSLTAIAEQLTGHIRYRLIHAGLAIEQNEILTERSRALWCLFAIGVLGVSRLLYGLQNDHAIAFLIVLLFVTKAAFLYHAKNSPGLTSLGQETLIELKRQHQSLQTDCTKPNASDGASLGKIPVAWVALGFALFGTQAVMASEDFAGINYLFGKDSINTTGNSKDMAGCGGGCGGGGGGGGGGCGGGCGGCGG